MNGDLIEQVRSMLEGAGRIPVGPEDVLDALWLAAAGIDGPAATAPDLPERGSVTGDATVELRPQTPVEAVKLLSLNPVVVEEAGGQTTHLSQVEPVERSWEPLDDPLGIGRALRPLRLRRRETDPTEFDELATAERSIAGRWEPVLRAGTRRWPDLALVADGPAAERFWAPVVDAFGLVLERLGGFREIRRWHLSATAEDGPSLVPWEETETSRARPAGQLKDPTGRRLIVVVTDGSDPAWGDGTYSALLQQWAAANPVLVVSTIPEGWGPSDGLETVVAQVRAGSPLQPNARWRARPVRRADGTEVLPAGIPVPVVDLEAISLARMAEVIAGEPRWVRTRLITTRNDVPARPRREPRESVRRFRSRVEPQVYELLLHLSSAPLEKSLIERVSCTFVPTATRRDAARILLSDLVEPMPAGAVASPPGLHPPTHRFRPGVAAVLGSELNPVHRAATRSDLLCYGAELDVDLLAMSTFLPQQEPLAAVPASAVVPRRRLVMAPALVVGLPTPARDAAARRIAESAYREGELDRPGLMVVRGEDLLARPARLAAARAEGAGGALLISAGSWLEDNRNLAVLDLVAALVALEPPADPVLVLAAEAARLAVVLRRHPGLAARFTDPAQRRVVPPTPADSAFMTFFGRLKGEATPWTGAVEDAVWELLQQRMADEEDMVAFVETLARAARKRHGRRDPAGPLDVVDLRPGPEGTYR